jgi:nucleoid-associated protein YgaU
MSSRWLRALVILPIILLLAFPVGLLLLSAPSPTARPPRPVAAAEPVSPTMWHATPRPVVHHAAPRPVVRVIRTYTVRAGDTLWTIATHVYHNPGKWSYLWHHNARVIGNNPGIIRTGERLEL